MNLSGWMMAGLLAGGTASAGGHRELFNESWRFARYGQMPDGSFLEEPAGLEQISVNDSEWRPLRLPHDWGIEGPFREDIPNSTGKLPWVGIGWYRRTFALPQADQGKRIFIDFDGAMSNTRVWLNGQYVGEWPYGYSSFRFDLTPYLKFGEANVLAVRLDNPPDSSRWYPGGGIYRNVHLVKTDPVHLAHWGVSITTPDISDEKALVRVVSTVENQGDTDAAIILRHRIFEGSSAKPVAELTAFDGTVRAGSDMQMEGSLSVLDPQRWDVTRPVLYTLRTQVLCDGKVLDSCDTPFGIRSIEYDAAKGFLLNGRHVKLQGVCLHHDLGPLGSAVNRRAIERQLEIMQEMGCNAIRTSHNPPAPELLDLCDQMGMLVQVEAFDCWKKGKNTNDYHLVFDEWHDRDLTAMVRRDRNHPSVIMWSSGNEVREQNASAEDLRIAQSLTDIIHREDPTRPISVGCNHIRAGFNRFAKTMDVFGYNYKPQEYARFREQNPDMPLCATETSSCISSRGEYFFPVIDDKSRGCGGYFQVGGYDLFAPPWANKPDVEFEAQDRFPEVIGEFVWTGFDYLGEPTPYNKDKTNMLNFTDPEEQKRIEAEIERMGGSPARSSYFGIVDLCGFKKDRFYLYQAKWRPDLPMTHILPHWNWPERIGEVTPVHVYTSGDEAELFLNGRSLGRKKKGPYEYRLRWDDVVYEPGELRAVSYKDGKPWSEATMKTTGAPAAVALEGDRPEIRADGDDLCFVTVRIADADGVTVPRTHNLVKFSIEGPGELIAVGSGNPVSHESFQLSERKAFNGLCLAVIRSRKNRSGTITLKARSEGLQSVSLEIVSR
ncbi:MAG: beta-galactosidase GalB [Kiritimatiellales bacterium]